jgi:hypothetical protein
MISVLPLRVAVHWIRTAAADDQGCGYRAAWRAGAQRGAPQDRDATAAIARANIQPRVALPWPPPAP